MSFNARWGSVKIVEPINSSRAQELVGGLRNAFERGESFAKAKQSFINAGYKPSEVMIAAQEMRKSISSISQSAVTPTETKSTPTSKISQIKQLPKALAISSIRKKGISKALIIVLVILLILTLVSSAILGLFWDQWF